MPPTWHPAPGYCCGMGSWIGWMIGGLVLAVGAGVFTVVWWKIGDQWADAEYKRFGHGGGGPGSGEAPKVIRDFDGSESDDAESDDDGDDGDRA